MKLKFLTSILCVLVLMNSVVHARLLITPTRIELNNSNRVQALKLINESNDEVTYRIGYTYQGMNKDGSYTKLNDSEIRKKSDISKMVMYSPRQVTLQPRETQTVRFALRRKEGMKDEYNAHVLFKEIKKTSSIPQLRDNSDGDFSIQITPLFNIAIPIFVSDAERRTKMNVTIGDVVIDKKGKSVALTLVNLGKYSPYGDVSVELYKKRRMLTKVNLNGVSITMPLKERNILLSFAEEDVDMKVVTHAVITYRSSSIAAKPYIIAKEKIKL